MPQQQPEVSVIMATYNQAAYLRAAVQALFVQVDAPPYEIIVVNDGATDETMCVLEQLTIRSPVPFTVIHMPRNVGRAAARNAGIARAHAPIIAFTDSDCLPTPDWLARGIAALQGGNAGMVQGRTTAPPGAQAPLFSHFIELNGDDGSYATCNIFYRRAALDAVGGFDPQIEYWEDAELGWRVRRAGWQSAYAPQALVYHQVVPLTPLQWLLWPRKFGHYPARVARFPESRATLFGGIFLNAYHAAFALAICGVILAFIRTLPGCVCVLPYLMMFFERHGLGGRFPILKAAFHMAWDFSAFAVLARQSIRYRTLVL